MKKRNVLALLLTATMTLGTLGVAGCGEQELALTTERVEIELGSELDTAVTTYVADEKVAADATVDFSAVDTSKVGTYTVPITYNEQTASFEVEVVDTTAPVVECVDSVTVPVNTPVCAEDMIASVTELSGNVEVTIAEPVAVAVVANENTETEDVDSEDVAAEEIEVTEEVEATEAVADESTEIVESTETTEQAAEIVLEPFTVDNVLCNNDYVILTETGEYDAVVTVADMSGNTTEATVHIVVGEAPTISGVEDITVTVGADEVDYLEGVTAVDCNGNDITDKITCDSSIVDLETVGEYGIVYTVVDENGFEAHTTALVTVKEKSSGRTGSTSSTSSSSSKPGSTTTSSTSSTASSTTSTSTSTQSQSSQTTYSQDTSSSYDTSSQNNQTATQTPSADTTTSSNTSSVDTSTQTPSVDTSASTPSADTSTSTSTDGGMSVPDDVIWLDPSLGDNTGTGGEAGGDWAIGGGNF